MEVLYHPRSWKTGACVWKGEPLFIWDTGMAIILYAGCSHSVRRRERCFCGDGCQRFERQMTTFCWASLIVKLQHFGYHLWAPKWLLLILSRWPWFLWSKKRLGLPWFPGHHSHQLVIVNTITATISHSSESTVSLCGRVNIVTFFVFNMYNLEIIYRKRGESLRQVERFFLCVRAIMSIHLRWSISHFHCRNRYSTVSCPLTLSCQSIFGSIFFVVIVKINIIIAILTMFIISISSVNI